MNQMAKLAKSPRSLLSVVLTVTACLIAVSPAHADYEQVPEHFGDGAETGRLGIEARGLAVNVTGEGLPPGEAGSIYVGATSNVFPTLIARYSPGKEGEAPQLREVWSHSFPESVGGIAVDQTTGYVYVLLSGRAASEESPQTNPVIEVFTATGTPVGAFGEQAQQFGSLETIEQTPSKLHTAFAGEGGIAVDGSGTVYVVDRDAFGTPLNEAQARIMVFEPETAGDYAHYVYAGRDRDITTPLSLYFTRVALVGNDRLVTGRLDLIREYPTHGGSTPICSFQVPGGGLKGMTANPVTGEVFYGSYKDESVHRLGPCDEETGEFKEIQGSVKLSPRQNPQNIAINPALIWGPQRPSGTLYVTSFDLTGYGSGGVGDVLAPAKGTPPLVLSEAVTNISATSANLKATVDPRKFGTSYRFQYLTEAAFEANEPNERQSVTVSATGGLFTLGFEGSRLGAVASADLTAGSKVAENLVTASGAATIHAARGSAKLSGAAGTGTVIAGSTKVTAAKATEGSFAVGQTIVGEGIPSGTQVTAVSESELTISASATKSIANTDLKAGTAVISSLNTAEGAFEIGQTIEGVGIPPGTTIKGVSATTLTLSQAVQKPGTGVAITAGSPTLTDVSVSEGNFEVNTPISGEGIPSGTTITNVGPGSLTLSKAPNKPGSGVVVSSSGPGPLAVGETVEGPGIPSGTKIAALESGRLTLSAPAGSTAAGAHLRVGLPFDATAAEVQGELEGLPTIGEGNVLVSGGPGDAAGSTPYLVEFAGTLTNRDLAELATDSSNLVGGPATATASTENDGGGGFDHATEAPLGGGEISGSAVATVASGISGLGPETHYVFRIVAESECNGPGVPLCEVEGAATHFATYAETTTGLPDGRAYELVSPAQKSGGQVFPAAALRGSCDECKPPGVDVFAVFPMQSAPGGNSVVYSGSPFSPNEGAAVLNSYLSRRTSNGWSTTAMSPDLLSASGGKNETYDSQLARGIISQDSPQLSPQAPIGYANLYLQSAGNPQALQPLLTKDRFAIHPPKRGPGDLKLSYSGSSADYSAHFFSANDALADATTYAPESPDPGFSGRNLYEWRGGALALVNVLPSNTEVAANASFASVSPDAYGISQNGRRVFWEAEGQLYVREDNRTTREIHHPGQFLEASPDGLQVLLSDGCLYSLTTATCTDLTDGKGGFQGIVGATKDLSKIYFIDQAALTAEAEAGKCQVVGTGGRAKEEELEGRVPPGWGCNLYSWESGTAPTLVATLLAADNVSTAQGGTWAAAPGKRTAQASPSGRYLAFVSKARLASNSPEVPCKLHSAEPTSSMITCEEVYLYDSKTNDVICPSCNPAGEAPLGISNLRLIEKAPAVQAQPRYLTDSGRLVFDSQDRLSPLDTNSGVEDVYQFEPQGTGSCSRASGCVSLISSGSGSVDSNFLAMDESGANIFFTSRERLVQKDMDELIDIYDAREFGGFPTESESQRTECQGESCQPVPQPPDDATPASSTFHGAGNVKEGASHRKKRKHKKRRHHRRKHHSRTAGDKRAVNHQGRGAK